MEKLRPHDVRQLAHSYLVGGRGTKPTCCPAHALSSSITPDVKQRLNEYLISDVSELGPGLLMEFSGLPLPSSGPSPSAQALLERAEGGPFPPPWAHHICHWSQNEAALWTEKKTTGPHHSSLGRHPVPLPHRTGSVFLFVLNLLSSKFSVLILCDRQPSDFSPSTSSES